MKRILIILFMLFVVACSSTRFATQFYYIQPNDTQYSIDSIFNVYNIQSNTNYTEWDSSPYFTNDSVVIRIYQKYIQTDSVTYFISVTDEDIIKFRIEQTQK